MRPWIGVALVVLALAGCGRQPTLPAEPPTRELSFVAAPGAAEAMTGLVAETGRLIEFRFSGTGFAPEATYTAWLRDDLSGDRRALILEGVPSIPVAADGKAAYDVLMPVDAIAPWEAIEIYRPAPGETSLDGARRVAEAPLPEAAAR